MTKSTEHNFWFYIWLLTIFVFKVFPWLIVYSTMFSIGLSGAEPPDFQVVANKVVERLMPVFIDSFNQGARIYQSNPSLAPLGKSIGPSITIMMLLIIGHILYLAFKASRQKDINTQDKYIDNG